MSAFMDGIGWAGNQAAQGYADMGGAGWAGARAMVGQWSGAMPGLPPRNDLYLGYRTLADLPDTGGWGGYSFDLPAVATSEPPFDLRADLRRRTDNLPDWMVGKPRSKPTEAEKRAAIEEWRNNHPDMSNRDVVSASYEESPGRRALNDYYQLQYDAYKGKPVAPTALEAARILAENQNSLPGALWDAGHEVAPDLATAWVGMRQGAPKPLEIITVSGRTNMSNGNRFNQEQRPYYPYNELYLENGTRLDSYDPNTGQGEIVSRKNTQFWEITPATARGYISEAATKYAPGTRIADVPSSVDLAGRRLQGQRYLEVPVQRGEVPREVLDWANQNKVFIRDTKGRIYNQ